MVFGRPVGRKGLYQFSACGTPGMGSSGYILFEYSLRSVHPGVRKAGAAAGEKREERDVHMG